jgi:hypothetical protein
MRAAAQTAGRTQSAIGVVRLVDIGHGEDPEGSCPISMQAPCQRTKSVSTRRFSPCHRPLFTECSHCERSMSNNGLRRHAPICVTTAHRCAGFPTDRARHAHSRASRTRSTPASDPVRAVATSRLAGMSVAMSRAPAPPIQGAMPCLIPF